MSDDFGFYGKGLDGYVHYKQSFDSINKGGGGGGGKRPPTGGGCLTVVIGAFAAAAIVLSLIA